MSQVVPILKETEGQKNMFGQILKERGGQISLATVSLKLLYAEANDATAGPLDPGEPHLLPHGQLHLIQHQAVHVTDMKRSQLPICCLFERERKSKTPQQKIGLF